MFSGLSGSIVRAQAGSFYQRSSLCVLHLSVPRPPACIEEAAAAAGLPRVRATNQIVVPFISLTQAVTPTRQAFSRRAFSILTKPMRQLFCEEIQSRFRMRKKTFKIILQAVLTPVPMHGRLAGSPFSFLLLTTSATFKKCFDLSGLWLSYL